MMLTIEMKIGFYRTGGMSFHVSVYIRPFERDNYSVVYVMCQKYEAQVAKSNYNRFTGEDVTLLTLQNNELLLFKNHSAHKHLLTTNMTSIFQYV